MGKNEGRGGDKIINHAAAMMVYGSVIRVDTLQTAWVVGCGNCSILLSKLWLVHYVDSNAAAC